jgi:hypothetical protein
MPAMIASAGASLLGGFLQGKSAERAARTQADAQRDAARIAAEESRFRPVGITTRFGQSNFQTDANGRVIGAGYQLDPALRAYQDRFMGLAGGGLSQAEQAQQQFAPLQQGAQGLFGLGNQYLAESPQQAAQRYMASQQELLAPSREREMAQLQTRLFNTGRGGLSVGATGARPSGAGGLGAASPELEAYYNAIAQQDAQLAAQATQGGMDQARFGAGLLGTGGNLMTQGYQGQAAALSPYEAYLNQMKQLEALGLQSLDIGSGIGAKVANPSGGQYLYGGGMGAAQTMGAANAYNPFATALTQASQNPAFQQGIGNLFGRPNYNYGAFGGGSATFGEGQY